MIYPKNAKEAFEQNTTYRPRTYGIGINAMHPRENGVELITRAKVLDDVEVEDLGSELVLFHYLTSPTGHVRKQVVIRKPAPEMEQKDRFSTSYDWVESSKKVA
jgi:hypothetical protein